MLQTKLKALLACVCVLACVIGFTQGALFSAAANDADSAVAKETFDLGGKTEVVVENDNLKFTFDVATCFFKIEDLKNGKVWYSNPTGIWDPEEPEEEPSEEETPDEEAATPAVPGVPEKDLDKWEEDPLAKGKFKQQLATTLIVHYIDKNGARDTAASRTSSVQKGTYEVKGIENGVRIDFEMSEGFTIPVELELKEDRFCARVIAEEIYEKSAHMTEEEKAAGGQCNVLSKVELLPYFGAGSTEDTGYIVVPDGSGAVIDFNNGKSAYTTYSQPVYGRDVSETLLRKETTTQDATLPVFGIQNGDGAMLGVITQNASAEINAGVSGAKTSYNNASVTFRMRGDDTYTLGTTVYTRVQQFIVYEEGGINADFVEMSYFFLGKEDSDYAGMAKRYQQYLIEEEGMTVAEDLGTSVFLELYGGVEVTRPVMGIQTDVIQKITGYDEAKAMLEKLKAAGVDDITVRYVNWDKNLIQSKAGGKVSLLGDFGGKKAFGELVKYCNDNGFDLYLDQELQVTNNFGNGFLSFSSGAQTINGTLIRNEAFSIQLLFESKGQSTKLMSMINIDKISDKVLAAFEKLGKYGDVGISTGSFGNTLYSDYRQTGWIRDDSANAIAQATEKFAKEHSVMANGGNLPAVLNADKIINLSFSSSRFDITDRSIPFYQLVMSGVKNYSSSAANLTSSVQEMTLQAIESGSMMTFLLTETDYDNLRDTKYTTLYSIEYSQYAEDVVEAYNTLTEVYGKTEGSALVDHRYVKEDVAKAEYENGAIVYVNYNDSDIKVDGVTVPANGYTVKGGN